MTALNRRDAEDPDFPGIELQTPERMELSDVIRGLTGAQRGSLAHLIFFTSRADLLADMQEHGTQTPSLQVRSVSAQPSHVRIRGCPDGEVGPHRNGRDASTPMCLDFALRWAT